jgi:predicted dehydrogenase
MKQQLLPLAIVLGVAGSAAPAADLRVGIIGLDTSHVVAFTKVLNDPADKDHVAGARVVAAFKGGSPDIEASASRIEGFTKTVQEKYGVKIVGSIEELCQEVDAVLLDSVDGRPHLEQARPVLKAKKPIFIDKPIAASLRDAIEIFRLAKASSVPVFSSSSYRFYESLIALKKASVGEINSVIAYGPAHLEPHHPDLYYYGIHPTEALFTVMGTGCNVVVRTATTNTDVVTGIWNGGKVGTLQGFRNGPTPNKVTVFGTKGVAEQKEEKKGSSSYAPLLREIVTFFQTGIAPVSPAETLEIMAFMEAADESKRQGGVPVKLSDVMKKNGWKE